MPSAYRFAGKFLAQAASPWDVQHQNCGMLELNIDKIVPGGKETLILSLADFSVPGRQVGTENLPYINGNSRYPTRPEPFGNVVCTFRDFPRTGTRAILHQWFKAVFDEETGLMLPPSLMKTNGYVVLFQSDGTLERTGRLEGVFPTNDTDVNVSYQNGEVMLMPMNLSVDRLIWEPSLFTPVGSVAALSG